MSQITTDRLTLRAAQAEDLAPLFDIYSDARAMRYWDSPPHRSPEETKPLHDRLMAPGPRRYFVWDLKGAVIGTGGLHKEAELGYILHPDYWGRGLAREAVQAILDFAWGTLDLDRITAEADPRNLASVGLLSRLGFCVCGFAARNFFTDGRWGDSVYLGLDRPEAVQAG